MKFRVEQNSEGLWLVQSGANSAILATGTTKLEALEHFQRNVMLFCQDEVRKIARLSAA